MIGAHQPVRLDQFVSIQQSSHEGGGPRSRRDNGESATVERRVFGTTFFQSHHFLVVCLPCFGKLGVGAHPSGCMLLSVIRHCYTYWYDVSAVFVCYYIYSRLPGVGAGGAVSLISNLSISKTKYLVSPGCQVVALCQSQSLDLKTDNTSIK